MGGLPRRAVSFYLTPWDDVKSTTSLRPPTPHLTSICRGTNQTAGFVWGVGVMTERSHTHSVPAEVENNRYSGIIGGNLFYSSVSWRENALNL